jgi:DNA-binding IclR family transcriptional regulator
VSPAETYFASRAMQALEVLAFGPATTSQVAAELQVHQRTARRLLNRLVSDGWLVRRAGPRPTYTPTLRIVAVAAELAQRAPLVRHAGELAAELQARTAATVHLAVPSYRSALRLVRVAEAGGGVARRDLAPAHAVAAGKALLAFRDGWRAAVLAAPPAAVTERTLTEPAALARELAQARVRGYAIEDGEFRPGVRAIALPVRGDGGDVVAALALSGATLDGLLAHREALREAADRLSARLAA